MTKETKCNHAIASHEGHGMLYYPGDKYNWKATKEGLHDDCCGGTVLFNYCPFCGKEVRSIIKKIENK